MSEDQILYQAKFLRLIKDGETGWEYVERGTGEKTGVVCVLPIMPVTPGLTMTRLACQYRPALKTRVLSLVAGLVDKGETSEQAAKRELLEEVGLISNDFQLIGDYPSSAGLTNETVKVYLAFDCVPTKNLSDLDTTEGIEIISCILDDHLPATLDKLAEGMMIDAKIYAAFSHYKRGK